MSDSHSRTSARARAAELPCSARRGPEDADATGAPWPFIPRDPAGNAVAQADGAP